MSYSIYYDFGKKVFGEDYEVVGVEPTVSDVLEYFDKEEILEALNEKKFEEIYEKDIVDWFEEQDMYFEWEDRFVPIVNYIHILQSKPTEKQAQFVAQNSNAVIVHVDEFDTYGIALTGAGMDFSDSIALAYAVVDNEIPNCFIKSINRNYTITEAGWNKLKPFLKDKQ